MSCAAEDTELVPVENDVDVNARKSKTDETTDVNTDKGDDVSEDLNKIDNNVNKKTWIENLRGEKITLPGVESRKINYTKRNSSDLQKLRAEFDSKSRKEFLQQLGNDPDMHDKFIKSGLTTAEASTAITLLKDGKVPIGYQVHHKLPLDDGGTNDMSNLVLIKNDPYHKAITNFQNKNTKGLKPGETINIEFPIPPGRFYSPPYIENY